MVHRMVDRLVRFSTVAVLLLSQVVYSTAQETGRVEVDNMIMNANVPPVVEVIPDVSSGKAPLTVQFDGDVSDDGEIWLVEWDFEGDGVFEILDIVKDMKHVKDEKGFVKNELQKAYTYTKPGVYHVLVRATDDKDESSVASVTIQVHSDMPWLDVVPCDNVYAYMARAGYEAFFKSQINENEGIRFQIQDAWISYQLEDQAFGEVNKTTGAPEGNMIWYCDVFPNVDVRYTVYEDLLLEEFIVKKFMPLTGIEQSFETQGVEYQVDVDGSLDFYNGETFVFSIPKPVMYELGNPQKKCYGLHYEIVQKEDKYLLKKVIDDVNWLKTAEYPVVIDSSTQGELADPWEQQGLTPYGQYFKNVNEYVDPLTGHLTIRHTDYRLSGRGLDLSVTRVYSTAVAYKQGEDGSGEYIPVATYQEAPTDLGCGWRLDFPWLEVDDSQPGKYMHLPNGVQVKTSFQNGVWVNELYSFTMYENADNTYTKYRKNGIKEEYDSEGRITSIVDLNGNAITFTYGQHGIATITDTVGRMVTFSYSGEKLTSISDGVRIIIYNYAGDKLTAVTDPLGRATSYDYLDGNSFLITGVHYPSGGFSSYEYAAVVPETGKLAPYKSSNSEDSGTVYYVYKVDSPDTVTWTSPKDINSVTVSAGRPCVLQEDDGSLVMYFKDKYVWTESVWKCYGGECWEEIITHTEYWIRYSVSTDQHHWSVPQNVTQVKSTTGNPVVIEKQDGSFVMYYKDKYVWTEENCYWEGRCPDCQYICDTITHTEYWIYRRTSADGLIWQSPVKVQKTTLSVRNISVIQKQDSTFLMCYTDKVGTKYYIRQKTSNNGITWSSPSNVVQVNSGTENPALLQRDSGTIYLAYQKSYIFVVSNSGSGWSSPTQTTGVADGDPSLLETDSDIIIIYRGTDGHCYRISSTDGATWSSPFQIAPNKAISDPATVVRKDRFYRVTAQYVSASAADLVKVLEFSYEGDSYLPYSSDVIIRDAQTLQSSIHLEYDSKGRVIEKISKDEQGVQTEKIVYIYNNKDKVIRQDVYAGTSAGISYSTLTGYDDKGNVIYTKDPEGAEHFYSYSNTNSENQFTDSKCIPVNLFSNRFYTNTIPSDCHTLPVGESFSNNGKVQEIYYKYDTAGNLVETKTLFPTRNYAVFSGTFDETTQSFEFDLTGLTITDGVLVISSTAVPTSETLHETHSEVGTGWQNTGSWSGKYFLADYFKCTPEPDCFDGETKIGPFEHCPGSPDYTGYTTWVEDRIQYVQTHYFAVINEYPGKVEYKLNNSSWTVITSNLGSGTTSTVIPASFFVQGSNALRFQESNTYSTKFEWTLYIDQGGAPEGYITSYTYDAYGNLTSVTNAEEHTTTLEYSVDYNHAYLTSRTDIVDGQAITVSATYDFETGNITSRTCACGSVTYYEYDLLGRLTKVIYPLVLGEQEPADHEIVYDDTNSRVTLFNENDEKTVKYYDGLGRMIKIEQYKDTLWAQWLYEYNYLDKPKQMTDPLSRVHQYEYNSLGKVTKFINPDQTFRTIEYDDVTNTITVKDENHHKKVYTFNWTGNLLSVKEYYSSSYYLTGYQYDQAGNLTQMRDPEQNVYNYIYDSVFGITAAVYPDATEQHFTYDNIGNVVERVDQNGNRIAYTYDALSRMNQINYQDTSVSFVHDAAGNRTSMITPDVTTSYTYDARNRLRQVTYNVDGVSYNVAYSYDPTGNITEVTYPDDTTVHYTYGLEGQLESIQDYASFTWFQDGNLEQILFSNGVITDFAYDLRGRIKNIHAYTATDLLDLIYSYDSAGNITQICNNFLTASEEWITSTEVYMYDDLDRLVTASNDFGTLSYTCDSKNRLSVTENGETTAYVYNYDLLLSAGQKTFTHDANGNTLTKSSESEWVYHYDKANRLIQVDKNSEILGQYVYGGDDKRIKRTEWSEDLQQYITTIYVYSGSDVIYEETTNGTALYVYGPTGKIAKRTTINDEINTFYYTKDHSGSTRLVTDTNSTPLTSVKYYPFGRHEYSGSPESYLFTGKERDSTDLYYFGARYYDSETGRFLTRDPYTFLPDDPRVVGNPSETHMQWLIDPQRFNRFSYTRNNPLRYKDPTGLEFQCIDVECQNLFDGGEDPPPDDTAPNDSHDDDEHKTREDECRECDCKDRPDVKALRTLKKKLYLGEIGIGAAYAFLCAIVAAILCLEVPPAEIGCAAAGALLCGLYFTLVAHASLEDTINDIHWAMEKLHCECAIYC